MQLWQGNITNYISTNTTLAVGIYHSNKKELVHFLFQLAMKVKLLKRKYKKNMMFNLVILIVWNGTVMSYGLTDGQTHP